MPGDQDAGQASKEDSGRDDVRRVHRSEAALREEHNQGEKKPVDSANSSPPQPRRSGSESEANHHGHKDSLQDRGDQNLDRIGLSGREEDTHAV